MGLQPPVRKFRFGLKSDIRIFWRAKVSETLKLKLANFQRQGQQATVAPHEIMRPCVDWGLGEHDSVRPNPDIRRFGDSTSVFRSSAAIQAV
jgi:hypothetical protein